jgi:preprotein translocase SecE subunit
MKDRIIGYLKETLAEMRKVVWPDQRYVTVATIIILVLVALTGVFVLTIDFGLGKIFTALLNR